MPMIEPFAAKTLFVLLRFGRWDDVLALPRPDPKYAVLRLLSHLGRGISYAALGHLPDARVEQAAYYDARKRVPGDMDWGYNKARSMLAVADAVFDGVMASAQRKRDEAVKAWERAVAAEDALNYNEPPDWFYPTRESLGGALMRAMRFEEAERVYRADLERNPKNGRSLYGLWQSLLAQARVEDAAKVEREFREAWRNADVQPRLSAF
jgi:tetratricopeptide (TPR) repeat protein